MAEIEEKYTAEKKWILWSIPILFIVAALFHFLFDFSNHNQIVGIFAPVNESVWEHLKLLLMPIILWWSIFYIQKGEQLEIDKNKWFFGCLVSLISSMLFTLAFFYTYTSAFGIESLALDILDTFLSIAFGQLLGFHIYKYSKGINWAISVIIIVLIVIMFGWFTFNPPELPIFLDKATGTYGIKA